MTITMTMTMSTMLASYALSLSNCCPSTPATPLIPPEAVDGVLMTGMRNLTENFAPLLCTSYFPAGSDLISLLRPSCRLTART